MDTTVAVIGAGQAGLAMSYCLATRGVDHVLLERGQVANSWRTERWDSLRTLTPNWYSQLPGWEYRGGDPEGFMTAADVVTYLDRYRAAFDPPVMTDTAVLKVERTTAGFAVVTDRGDWRCRSVVIATGAASDAHIPTLSTPMPRHVEQILPTTYRNAEQLADGPVIVVGAAASGVQIAEEVRRSGRDVTLSVGEHVRLPRSYRGMDIYWWLHELGHLDERVADVDDVGRARRLPAPQLVGSPERRTVDLNSLAAEGVRIVGRLAGVRGHTAQCSGSLANMYRSADLKLQRLLDRIDDFATAHGLDDELTPPHGFPPTRLPTPTTEIDLSAVHTIVWATGFRPRYPWLDTGGLDRRGAIVHDGGVTTVPGMYVLGLRFLRRRSSNFIAGVGRDASELTDHLVQYLGQVPTHVERSRRS